MQKWRGMHKGLPDAPKRSKYRVRKGWHRVLFENSAKHPTGSSGKDSPKDGRTYRHVEDAEDSPTHIPFREGGARHHYRTGWFKKFLLSRVGRSWDSVYSEIRRGLDYRSGAQRKTLERILWYVEIKCWMSLDGEIYSESNGRPWPVSNNTFYVHPETGTLEYSDNASDTYKRHRAYGNTRYDRDRILDPSDENNSLEKDYNGIWYAFRSEAHTEIIEHGHGQGRVENITYEMRKMQLSTRELSRCGLENEFMEFTKWALIT